MDYNPEAKDPAAELDSPGLDRSLLKEEEAKVS
jgi:hypothetical protein